MSDFGDVKGWTREKLDCLEKYLTFYQKALKGQRFRKIYIDAFAGSGGTYGRKSGQKHVGRFLEGSASRALRVEPPFDRYVFVERDPGRMAALKATAAAEVETVRARGSSVDFEVADANEAIPDLVSRMPWRSWRGVVFLDPYGMQVRWRVLEALARTESVDLWYLFPTGAMLRLLKRHGRPSGGRAQTLDAVLGTDEWRALYRPPKQAGLFPEDEVEERAEATEVERFVLDRLGTIFPLVHRRPLVLRNSKGAVLFSLIFACANPNEKAWGLAKKVADHLLGVARRNNRA